MLNIKINIPKKTFRFFKESDIYDIMQQITNEIRAKVIEVTPRDKGAAAGSWTPVAKEEGGYSFGSDLPYIRVLQYGSEKGAKPWPSRGPKTVEDRGRIYSSQAVGGFMQKIKTISILGRIFKVRLREWSKK